MTYCLDRTEPLEHAFFLIIWYRVGSTGLIRLAITYPENISTRNRSFESPLDNCDSEGIGSIAKFKKRGRLYVVRRSDSITGVLFPSHSPHSHFHSIAHSGTVLSIKKVADLVIRPPNVLVSTCQICLIMMLKTLQQQH